ncbi:MAG TPA: hypothetical protein VGA67_00085 [Candidatus Dojkabacteria bacterium]
MPTRPNAQEIRFLSRAYNFFLDIHNEIESESFWKNEPYYRLSRFRDALLIYSEILEYEPIGWFLEAVKRLRPPMEAELSKEYLLFIRNVLVHFPFFKSWDEIKFTKEAINWSKPGRSIDKFLSRFAGHEEVKYRIWNPKNKTMTYVSINFPEVYTNTKELFLKDFMPEKEGLWFVISLMYQVLMSQVEDMKDATEGG